MSLRLVAGGALGPPRRRGRFGEPRWLRREAGTPMSFGDHLLAAVFRRNRWELLLTGMVLIVLARGWPGIAVLAWFAPIPWLHFLRHNPRGTQGALLGLAWLGAWAMAWALAPAPGLGLASTLSLAGVTLAALLAWGVAARTLAPNEGLLAFGLLMAAVAEVMVALGLAQASQAMGATGIAVLDRLTGLLGPPAMAFVVHWAAATMEGQWETIQPASMRHHACVLMVVLLFLLVAGAATARLTQMTHL